MPKNTTSELQNRIDKFTEISRVSKPHMKCKELRVGYVSKCNDDFTPLVVIIKTTETISSIRLLGLTTIMT